MMNAHISLFTFERSYSLSDQRGECPSYSVVLTRSLDREVDRKQSSLTDGRCSPGLIATQVGLGHRRVVFQIH